MDLVDTLPDVRYWSEVLCCTIMTHNVFNKSDVDVDVNADADAVMTAIALPVLMYRRAKKKLYDNRIFAPRFTD